MVKFKLFLATASALLGFSVHAQKAFTEDALSFKSGEKLTYVASYNWGIIFTDVGEASLSVNKENDEYNIKGTAKTYSFYDKIFKVRDYYESRFELPSFQSVYFHRNIIEGDYKMKNTYVFDWDKRVINATIERQESTERKVELKMENTTLDVLTYFYYLRNLDYTNAKTNDLYTTAIALDDGIFNIKCRFLGREAIKVKDMKIKVNCLKFAVEVIAGSVFKGNEKITLWVSDDFNHIPILIESPIIVGKVKARITKFENLRHPLNLSL